MNNRYLETLSPLEQLTVEEEAEAAIRDIQNDPIQLQKPLNLYGVFAYKANKEGIETAFTFLKEQSKMGNSFANNLIKDFIKLKS